MQSPVFLYGVGMFSPFVGGFLQILQFPRERLIEDSKSTIAMSVNVKGCLSLCEMDCHTVQQVLRPRPITTGICYIPRNPKKD